MANEGMAITINGMPIGGIKKVKPKDPSSINPPEAVITIPIVFLKPNKRINPKIKVGVPTGGINIIKIAPIIDKIVPIVFLDINETFVFFNINFFPTPHPQF